jgi:16S rRNA (adenine1518-N6/adenine1519-N6)-dimethyltransferase
LKLLSPEDPRAVLRVLEQHARKRFGQHFLADAGTVRRIVNAAGVEPGDRVVEIGPGLGILTSGLLEAGADLLTVELDRDLAAYLRTRFPELKLVEADAARIDWVEHCPGSGWSVVSNLPYNVGTHVVMQLLRLPRTFQRLTVMLQKEVVDRLAAEPDTRAYGALSVEAQVRATILPVLDVPPARFHPPPKVDSCVVRLDLFEQPMTGVDPDFFDRVVRAAFSHRRKTLPNSMGGSFPREHVESALEALGISANIRAEALGLDQFRALASTLRQAALPAGATP